MEDNDDPAPEASPQAPDPARLLAESVARDFYETILERQPGESELAEWADALLRGVPIRDVRRAFQTSEERRTRDARAVLKRLVQDSGLFDPDWYLATYPDVADAGLDPLTHYCGFGMQEGRTPNRYFSPFWYRERNALNDVADALPHYMAVGERDALPPGPDFDPVWYRRVQGLPEDVPALADCLARRSDPTVAPCARLWSVRALPDADPADPVGRFLGAWTDAETPASADAAVLRDAGLFDENFYAMHSSDVLETGMKPFEHFCRFGWREGRDPNFYFRVRWYLATNPEAAALDVNPLIHYALVGEKSGRRPAIWFDPAWYRATHGLTDDASPLAHYLANRRSQTVSPNPLFDPAWYASREGVRLHANRDPFPHFLSAGMTQDVNPSPGFEMKEWRRRLRGRPSRHFVGQLSPERDNPLVLYLMARYV